MSHDPIRMPDLPPGYLVFVVLLGAGCILFQLWYAITNHIP